MAYSMEKKRKKINKSKDVLALGTSRQNIVIKFNSGEGWSHMLEEWITKKNQTMLFRWKENLKKFNEKFFFFIFSTA